MKKGSYELPSNLDREARKNTGAFYTPDPIVDFMVEQLLADAPLPLRICDISCGGGAFLAGVLRYVRKHAPEKFASCCAALKGIDINPEAVALARKNLPMIPPENFICADALELDPGAEKPFDIIIGNPPYRCGGLKNNAAFPPARRRQLQERFPAGFEYKMNLFALFMEQSARMADEFSLIVPDSLLCGRYFSKLRRFLLENCSIKTLVVVEKPDFDAAAGNCVIIHVKKALTPPTEGSTWCASVDSEKLKSRKFTLYPMEQRRFYAAERSRFQLYFSDMEKRIVEKLLACESTVRDHFRFASGIIAKGGKNSIVSALPREGLEPGIVFGREIHPFEICREGFFLDLSPEKIKSGLDHKRFSGQKIFLRQTGSRLVAAVSREKLYALNNCHTGTALGSFPADTLAALLNSSVINFLYAFISGERNRNFAQIDIDLLDQLPLRRDEEFDRYAALCARSPEHRRELDSRCARLFGVSAEELSFIQQTLQ